MVLTCLTLPVLPSASGPSTRRAGQSGLCGHFSAALLLHHRRSRLVARLLPELVPGHRELSSSGLRDPTTQLSSRPIHATLARARCVSRSRLERTVTSCRRPELESRRTGLAPRGRLDAGRPPHRRSARVARRRGRRTGRRLRVGPAPAPTSALPLRRADQPARPVTTATSTTTTAADAASTASIISIISISHTRVRGQRAHRYGRPARRHTGLPPALQQGTVAIACRHCRSSFR
ncbi:unnamed protein product [Protopolystoma xenopodis]|uniref:Uncharacterized protein n=1 Tax=Protopolystoma xenopodis TaxID=117903 RepID=A0A448WW49_9PLAT|nr:unnamed protein product [Protopolystoma xenopodis]